MLDSVDLMLSWSWTRCFISWFLFMKEMFYSAKGRLTSSLLTVQGLNPRSVFTNYVKKVSALDSNLVAKFGKGSLSVPAWQCPCAQRGPWCTQSGVEPWLAHTKPRAGPHWTPLGWFGMQPASQGPSANISACLYCVWIGTNRVPCSNRVESLYREVEAPAVKERRTSY